jgi:cathepsin H
MYRSAAALMISTVMGKQINKEFQEYLFGEKNVNSEVFDQMWKQFEIEHESTLKGSTGEDERRQNFQNSIERVIEHNKLDGVSYFKGINMYSDMSEDQFNEHFNLDTVNEDQHCSATDKRMSVAETKFGAIPEFWDWRDHKGSTPVKNQGKCGSCWTFSTVGALEGHTSIKYNGMWIPLAEQQLVDCAGDYDNNGCKGGLPSHAFEYIFHAGGIASETGYPYKAVDMPCTVNPDNFALEVIGGSVNITEGDEVQLAQALYNHGPVSVGYQVATDFRDYVSGVYTSTICKGTTMDINHAVTAIGYGVDSVSGMDYWLIKNSWGETWGEQGYFKMQRGVNMCGISVCNSYPQGVRLLNQGDNFLQY